jgi:hypothetical protein
MSPSIVPSLPEGKDIYLVLDDFGKPIGRCWRETDEARTDREMLIADLFEGQYSNPVRIVAFNTAEGWSRDVSAEIADLIAREGYRDGFPHSLEDFVHRHLAGGREQDSFQLRKV